MLADIKLAASTWFEQFKAAFSTKSTFSIALMLIPMVIIILVIYLFKIPVWKPAKKAYRSYRRRRTTRRRRRTYNRKRRR